MTYILFFTGLSLPSNFSLSKLKKSLKFVLFPDVRDVKMFVLDEADEMLSRGFKEQIYEIFRLVCLCY